MSKSKKGTTRYQRGWEVYAETRRRKMQQLRIAAESQLQKARLDMERLRQAAQHESAMHEMTAKSRLHHQQIKMRLQTAEARLQMAEQWVKSVRGLG